MRFNYKNLIGIILAMCFTLCCYAQDCTAPGGEIPKECYGIEGMVSSFYDKKSHYGRSSFSLFLIGTRADTVRDPRNSVRRSSKDVLRMSVGYTWSGDHVPDYFDFSFVSYSENPFKYEDNHKLSIYIDDKSVLSENTENRGFYQTVKNFSIEIKYSDYIKFLEAKKVAIQLGDTEIILKPDQIELLKELFKTTKEIKPSRRGKM